MSENGEIRVEDPEGYDSAANTDLSTKFLTFSVGGQYFGISIRNVIEIVQVEPATPMPELPYYAKGIINLRGKVVPLVDVNLRFGKPEQEYTDRTCIIIIDIDGVDVGFIVDAVDEVLDIEESQISPPPNFSAGRENRFVTGVCKLEKHMVLLLDSKLLFSDSEMGMLGSV